MLLKDFVEMVDWFVIHEQQITVIAQIMLEDESDLLENEMLSRAKFICNELSTDEYDLYESAGITPELKDGKVEFFEDDYGRQLLKDDVGRFWVVF